MVSPTKDPARGTVYQVKNQTSKAARRFDRIIARVTGKVFGGPVVVPEVAAKNGIRPGQLLSTRRGRAGRQWSCQTDCTVGGFELREHRLRLNLRSRLGTRAASGLADQPRLINVPIRSAGQTRLTGALINASLDGLLPSGKATMWWLKCASTPAR